MKCPIKFEVVIRPCGILWWKTQKYFALIINSKTNKVEYISKGYLERKDAYDSIKLIQDNALKANIYFNCDN